MMQLLVLPRRSVPYVIASVVLITTVSYVADSSAAAWYSAVNGNSTNGTRGQPWSVGFAVAATNTLLQPGDTVIFINDGTHVCTEINTEQRVGQVLEFRKSGTPSAKITYRAESLWNFSFDGGLLLTASNLVIRDCRIFYSGSSQRNRSNLWTHPPGIQEVSPGNKIHHNLIEKPRHPGIASLKATRGK